jgi:hypothetical protein
MAFLRGKAALGTVCCKTNHPGPHKLTLEIQIFVLNLCSIFQSQGTDITNSKTSNKQLLGNVAAIKIQPAKVYKCPQNSC